MSRKKQYRTVLNNYLAGKIGLALFYERANKLGVSAAESEGNITIVRMVREQFRDKPEEVNGSLIDHVFTLVERHSEACRGNGIEPEIYRVVIEAIEDYRLKQTTGISALDRAPNEATLPATRFPQYIPPVDVNSRKERGREY